MSATPRFSVGQRVRLTHRAAAWISAHESMPVALTPEALMAMVGEVIVAPTQHATHCVVRLPIVCASDWGVESDDLTEVFDDEV